MSSNKTAPLNGHLSASAITTASMKELISSIKIEDLIRSTEVDANAVTGYRYPARFFRKKRPTTAPPRAELEKNSNGKRAPEPEQDDEDDDEVPGALERTESTVEILS